MTQPSTPRDNVYLGISFVNIPRTKAEEIVRSVESLAGDNDFSVDYGDPIGDASPTPVADEAASAVGGDPTASDPSDPDTDNLPPVVEPQQPANNGHTSADVPAPTETPVTPVDNAPDAEPVPATPSDSAPDAAPVDAGTADPGSNTTELGTDETGGTTGVLTPEVPGTTQPTSVIDTTDTPADQPTDGAS